jgi:hypothetical protein
MLAEDDGTGPSLSPAPTDTANDETDDPFPLRPAARRAGRRRAATAGGRGVSAGQRSPARPLAPARASLTRRALAGAVWTLAWTLAWGGALMMFAHRAQAAPRDGATMPTPAFATRCDDRVHPGCLYSTPCPWRAGRTR